MTISWDDQPKKSGRSRAICSPLLCCALLLCGVSATPYVAPTKAATIVGDVNGDGVVTPADALAILTSLVGDKVPAGYNIANGDADGDGQITSLDAQIILAYAVGLQVSQYPVGKPAGS